MTKHTMDVQEMEGVTEQNPRIPPLEEWVQGAPEKDALDITKAKNIDRLLLGFKPAERTMRYTKMKASRNHFRVEDAAFAEL
jgi:hypothetical protein